jgi:MFS family permease
MSNEHSRIERLTGRERRRIRQALLGFALCVAFYSVQYALRSAPTVMLADLARAFNISSVDVGDLSSIFLYTYAIFALISGTVLDRFGARAAVPCGAAITAFGALLFVLDGFGAAEVGRLLQGAGSAFALTGAVYVAASGLPPSRLALAIGIAQAAGMFGARAGQWVVSVALRTWDVAWQSIWVAVVGILVLLALCIAVSLPGRAPAESQPASVGENAPASVLRPLQILFANPQIWFCAICAGGLFVPTAIGALIWRIPFYSTGLDVPYQQAVLSASMVPLGWVIGAPLLGWMSDRIGRRKPVLIAGSLILAVTEAIVLFAPAPIASYWAVDFVFGVASGAAMIPFSIVKEINPDEVKGTATGATNLIVFSMSAIIGSIHTWLLTPSVTGEALTAAAIRRVGLLGLGAIVLAVLLAFLLPETGPSGAGTAARVRRQT